MYVNYPDIVIFFQDNDHLITKTYAQTSQHSDNKCELHSGCIICQHTLGLNIYYFGRERSAPGLDIVTTCIQGMPSRVVWGGKEGA